MPVETVDETAMYTDMQGQASLLNVQAGKETWRQSPAKSLMVLWFTTLVVYWLIAYVFRSRLS